LYCGVISLSEYLPQGEPATDPPAITPASNKRSLVLIFFVILMDIIGITLLSPVAPKIVLEYNSSAVMVTMVTVIYATGQFFSSPLLGRIGDKVGRRPVLLVSLVGQSLGYFIFGVAGSLWMLFLGRLIGGITSGNISTSSAYIADISKPEERSKNFAMISTAWSLGLILGPAMGGILGQINLRAPAIAAGVITLINVILAYFLLPETLPKEKRDTTPLRPRDYNPIASIGDMARKPGLGSLLLVYALFSFAFNGINSTSALYMIQKFAAETWQISVMMIMSGISIALANTFLVPRWVPRIGERKSGTSGLLGLAVFSTSVFLAPFLWLAFILNMLGSAMSAFIFPSITTLSVGFVSPREVGQLLGVISAVGSLMNIFGPLWAGFIYDHVMMGAPYWMGGIILVVAALMLFRTAPHSQPINLATEIVEK
jgi:MFS transporter, DHA1 family, tetracycline resistance protein